MDCSSFLIFAILVGLGFFAYRRLARQGSTIRARVEQLELEISLLRSSSLTEQRRPGLVPDSAPSSGLREREPEAVRAPTPKMTATVEEPTRPERPSGAEMPPTPKEVVEPPPAEPPAEPRGEPHGEPHGEPPPPSRPTIDLEQWIGVRGAAVLGGVVLAIAGFFFLRYSIEAGWLSPAVRVALGTVAGVGSIVAGQVLRRRAYEAVANALAGAGVVLLYASTWAARVLYGLIGYAPAFIVMVVVTVTCGVLSWRYRSLVVALLGLIGGFATPLLLTSGRDNPLGLFGYLLLLNTGLAILARRSRWPLLGPLSLAATLLYQTLWIFARMDAGDGPLALVILAVFAIFFVVTTGSLRSRLGEPRTGRPWLQAAALATPFAFALYFAVNAEVEVGLVPLAALLALLGGAAAWLSRVHGLPKIEEGIAIATVAVIVVRWVSPPAEASSSWTAVLVTLALAAVFHLALEIDRRRGAPTSPSIGGALVAALGFLAWLVVVPIIARETHFWALATSWLGHAGLLLRQSILTQSTRRHRLAALAVGAGFLLLILDEALGGKNLPGSPQSAGLLAFMIAVAVAFQLFALTRRAGTAASQASAALIAAAPLLGLLFLPDLSSLLFHGAGAILALLVLVAATRSSSPAWYGIAAGFLVMVDVGWSMASSREPTELAIASSFQFTSAALFTFWPFIAGVRLRQPMSLRIAALAAPAWFFSLVPMFEELFGDGAVGLVPIALGAISLAAVAATRRLLPLDGPSRRVAVIWFSATALSLASVAIPLQVDREWVTVGWAIEGLAILLLWRRLDHPGLKYFGLGLLAAATVRLVANPALLEYHAKSAVPILNWLLYTYLVPAACLVGAARLLEPLEVERQRPAESWLYAQGRPVGAQAIALAAIVVVFAWINLTIADAFSPGPTLLLDWNRMPARDLTLSLAWALYALLLLGLGVVRASVGLRWISLTVLVLTIGKVFLYDLGELRDLYRVASLVGLAVSLILVSLLYQRFVFRRSREEPPS